MDAGSSREDWIARISQHLSPDGGTVEACAAAGRVLLRRDDGAALVVPAGVVTAMARECMLSRSGVRVALRGRDAGGSGAEDRPRGVAGGPLVNESESPIGALRRLRLRDGSRFLDDAEFNAGERLRSDYTRGRMMPRLGANWTTGVATGRRGDSGTAVDLSDAALAARQRVDLAIAAVGPELSGLLIDVCCFLKGMEQVEMERGWPARSAKVVLKAGLGVLARHYDPNPRARRSVLHWGSDDYRPRIA